MLKVIKPEATRWLKSTGLITPVATSVENIDFGTVVAGSNSTHVELSLDMDNSFAAADINGGFWYPRFQIQNMPAINGVSLKYLLDATYLAPSSTALVGAGEVPYLDPELENIDKATFFNATTNTLQYIRLQLQAAAGATPYDTNQVVRNDPRVRLVFERAQNDTVDAKYPNPNSDHLWNFTDVDIYVVDENNREWLVGWCADSDFDINQSLNTVDFQKGKPSATAARFVSEINSGITFTCSSFDPWLLTESQHISAGVTNRYLSMAQTNKQRPIGTRKWICRWRTSSGHIVELVLPKASLFSEGSFQPGGSDIASQSFTLQPLIENSGIVTDLRVTLAPAQEVFLPIRFAVN